MATRMTSAEALRRLGIYNPWTAVLHAKKAGVLPDLYITYRTSDRWTSSAWQVVRPGYQTDPDGHWKDYGHKTFIVNDRPGHDKQAALDEAVQWCEKRYGYNGEWDKVTGLPGAWFPRFVADYLKSEIRRVRKQAAEGAK